MPAPDPSATCLKPGQPRDFPGFVCSYRGQGPLSYAGAKQTEGIGPEKGGRALWTMKREGSSKREPD